MLFLYPAFCCANSNGVLTLCLFVSISRFLCSFHVEDNDNQEVDATKTAIFYSLMSNENISDAIQSRNVSTKHISKMDVQGALILSRSWTEFPKEKYIFILFFPAPTNCPSDTVLTIHGEFLWDESLPQETRDMICEKPDTERATRLWYNCSWSAGGMLIY